MPIIHSLGLKLWGDQAGSLPPLAPATGTTQIGYRGELAKFDAKTVKRVPPLHLTSTDPAQKLEDIFEEAYALDDRGSLQCLSPEKVMQLRTRLETLATLAFISPTLSEQCAEWRISRFFYLTHPLVSPELAGLLLRLENGSISLSSALANLQAEEVDLRLRLEEDSEHSVDLFSTFYERHQIVVQGLQTLFSEDMLGVIITQGATEIVHQLCPTHPLKEASPREVWNAMRRLGIEISQHSQAHSKAEKLKTLISLSFLAKGKGITGEKERYFEELSRQWSIVSVERLELLARIRAIAESPNPFERAWLWNRFPIITKQILHEAPSKEKFALHAIFSEIGNHLILSGTGQHTKIEDWAKKINATDELQNRSDSISSLPPKVKELAEKIMIYLPDKTISAWEFITEYTASIILLSQREVAPQFGRVQFGIPNVFFKTPTIFLPRRLDTDEDALEALAWIVHEVWHNYFFWKNLAQNPQVSVSTTLQERNAAFLEAQVLRKGLEALEEKTYTQRLMDKAARLQLLGLSTNPILAYPPWDHSIRADLNISTEQAQTYPNQDFMDHFCKVTGKSQADLLEDLKKNPLPLF